MHFILCIKEEKKLVDSEAILHGMRLGTLDFSIICCLEYSDKRFLQ